MVIRYVAPLSCAKIAGVLYAVMGLAFGAFFSLVTAAGVFADTDEDATFGALFGMGAVFLLPIFYGVIGFVMTAVMAWLYNLIAAMVGGIEMDVR